MQHPLTYIAVTKNGLEREKGHLTTWSPVMLTCKTGYISCSNTRISCLKYYVQIADLEERLSSGEAQIEMLTHSLSEKDAQLKMEVNKREVG